MALSDRNIVITPNIGAAADPKIVFSGADASTTAQNITLTAYPTNGGTLSFDGSTGQLFSVTNSMTGTIFSANDVSGIPSIEVLDTGLVKIAQYSGNLLLGSGTDSGAAKLQVTGNIRVSAGTTNPIHIGQDTGATTYNSISLNGLATDSGNMGMTGGGGSDTTLYINSTGNITFRTNSLGQTPLALTSSGASINGNTALHAGNYTSYALSLSGGNMSGNLGRTAHAAGFQVGSYNSVGDNSAKSNPIYTIGSNYNPSDTAIGGMYGIGYSHSSFFGSTGGVADWGLYVVQGGSYSAIFSGGGAWVKNTLFSIAGNTALHAGNYTSYSPTLTGGSASGTWGISVTGSSVTLSTGRTNWVTNGVGSAVVGMLGWKNYGNNHTIFDASAGTSPDGSAVNNTSPQVLWSATYPTLMGWNGANTYGVRVDVARYADSAGNGGVTSVNGSTGAVTISGGATITNDTTTNATRYIVWEDLTSGSATSIGVSNTKLTFNPSTGTLSATLFTSLSDESKKTNVQPILSAQTTVNSIDGVSFDWKDGSGSSYGFIAQELEKILPHAVSTDDEGIKSVNYSAVIPFLLETLKEQDKRISRLEALINKLID